MAWERPDKQRILFLAADATGTAELDREARSIAAELAVTDHRDRFDFVTRWAAQPLDLLRELRTLKPTVVHFSGHGGARRGPPTAPGSPDSQDDHKRAGEEAESGLYFVAPDRDAQWVSITAFAYAFEAAGASVQLIVLNAPYSDAQADALLRCVPCVIWMPRSLNDEAARSFAMGFYGGLGDGVSVKNAYDHGCAAIGLAGLPSTDSPRLRTRPGIDSTQLILAAEQLGTTAPVAANPATGRSTRATLRHKGSRMQRIALRIRTAFADGQGAYVLAMLAFGMAATFLYRSQRPERRYHRALASLVIKQQEPYRAEIHQVLAAGLLAGADWDPCKKQELYNKADVVVSKFTDLFNQEKRSLLNDYHPDKDDPETVFKCPQGRPPSCLKDCNPNEMEKCPRAKIGDSFALTDDSVDSVLIVPNTVAVLVNKDPDTKAILLASQKIEAFRGQFSPPGNDRELATLKNIYFVHLAGGIRIISPSPQTFKDLPAYRTYAATSYMYKHWRATNGSVPGLISTSSVWGL